MRVMQIIGSKGGGGAENFYLRLTESLHAAGEEVLAIFPPGSRIALGLDSTIPRQPIAMRGVWDLWARWQIMRAVRRFRPDIVQTWMGRATRLVNLPQGRRPIHVARLGGYYNLKGYRHAHAWVGNTQGICDYLLQEGLPRERVFHIGNFVDMAPVADAAAKSTTRLKFGIPADALLIVAVGRLHPNKGYPDLLQAFSRLPAELNQRPLRLLIAGDGELAAALRQQVESLRISDRLCWAGWQDDTGPLLDAADLFVCPSRHEPLGNVILEAWAHGAPVISTANDGAREIATHEHDALLTPCSDPGALAESIRELLTADAGKRTSLGAAGRDTLARHHSRQAVTAQYRELYERLLREVPAHG